jgi:ATP-dependent Lhr-like helicase
MQPFSFHPVVKEWFDRKFGTPTEPQILGWPAIQNGRHALISAPTGSGKTLAAFLAALDELFKEGIQNDLPNETRVLYVSPLRALSNDIRKNLQEPLSEIRALLKEKIGREIDVRVQVRTGDTPAAERQAIAKTPPHILVTTPESFYLLLTSESGRRVLGTVRTLIIDEIHALVDDRRGSHLALSMERLAHLVTGPLQRIGLSATQKPIEEVGRFLVGAKGVDADGIPQCAIINTGHKRQLDVALVLPGSPLEAVMSGEVWEEVFQRLANLIDAHRTTLVFVNTRRMAERVTQHLGELLGKERVTSHHGSLSADLRLNAEDRLKRGELKALVATASLELGIDIGSVDLVCQLGSTRSISTFLQRVGRAEHKRSGLPKGRLFPLSRDELAECAALLRSIRRGELDCLQIPEKPLDVLAQQIVASVGSEDWDEEKLFEMAREAWPYRNLTRKEFDDVVQMLASGFSTKRGRRAALIHYDGVNRKLHARRGSRLLALTSGGAIPDNTDFRVVLEPSETFIGTVNEDFAIESLPGDIFQLGNASWKILRVNSGQVRVEDAQGQPPSIPFWLGEAPGRTTELSGSVSEMREQIEEILREGGTEETVAAWLLRETGIPENGARQLASYFAAGFKALGAIPSRRTLIMERFFDESGGMQLVIHSPFGARMNRAWGLALRKRFCRSFNFELQAAATDDSIVLSLGTQHSFPLDEVFRYLNSKTVRDLLVQALLDAPMFTVRWRWNASRALAIPRQRGGRKLAAPLQRMESENLLAAVFPDQLACLENIPGDREVPDHPLVKQTIDDCLTEAMDIDGLEELLRGIEQGTIRCIARDLPEPSPLAHEILSARPYAFLDDAPLEERRTHAVYTRRALQPSNDDSLGILDAAAIDAVTAEAWPSPRSADELHETLLLLGVMTADEMDRATQPSDGTDRLDPHLLVEGRRAGQLLGLTQPLWIAAERIPMLQAIYPSGPRDVPARSLRIEPPSTIAPSHNGQTWERSDSIRELVRGRMEFSGPTTAADLAELLSLPKSEIDTAFVALEAEGFVLRGKFHSDASDMEWCERRILARIHRRTINRLRAEISPVSIQDYTRFLLDWQRLTPEQRAQGPEGLDAVIEQLEAFEAPVAAWEPEILLARVAEYDREWLDRAGFSGRIGWARLTQPSTPKARPFTPLRTSSVTFFQRENIADWLQLAGAAPLPELSRETQKVLETLQTGGAAFFADIVRKAGLFPSHVEQGLIELIGLGLVTADSFDGIRALLVPSDQRPTFGRNEGKRRHKRLLASIELAGRWWLLDRNPGKPSAEAIEKFAWTLLRRYGVVFRRLLDREALPVSWYDLGKTLRSLEARGLIRGGHFVSGVSGEQFALADAIGRLRSIRKTEPRAELITVSAADPLNLLGTLIPGPRLPSTTANRLLFRDGLPVATLEAGKIQILREVPDLASATIESALKIHKLPAELRPYY